MSTARSLFMALALMLAPAAVTAAPVAPPIAGDVAITGATVHVGDGRVIDNATVVLRDGLIASVTRGAAPPADVAIVEASGMHLAPGFTASDTVLGLVEISAVRATRDETEVGGLNPQVRAEAAFNPDSELLPVAMANGVLHAVVAPRGGSVPGQSALMMLSGWTREDMTLVGPAALSVTWPSLRIDRSEGAKVEVAEQEKKRDEAIEEIRDLFTRARAHQSRKPSEARVEDLRLEALGKVLDRSIPIVVHADEVPQIRQAMAWALAEGLRLVIEGGREAWRIADEIAAARVPVIIGSVRSLPAHDHDPYDVNYEAPVILHRAGVTVCFTVGADAFSAAHVRNLPDEAAMTIPWGMPPEAALQAITLDPARIFGADDRIGSVEAGKMANIVLWDGPPLEITSRVVRIYLRGAQIPLNDRHGLLRDKYRARPRPTR